MILRAGRDDDAGGFIDLIAGCWAEYPGCLMDVDGENPELRHLARYFAAAGGALWAAELDGVVRGMVAVRPLPDGAWELCRMYVSAAARGSGVSGRLLQMATEHARDHGGDRLMLWSDTRFERAHRFYERNGFVREGGIRPLFDISNSLEFGYAKPIAGLVVRALDVAAVGSASRSLGRILVESVAAGASVSFLPPVSEEAAHGFYRARASDIARGHRVLLAAWLEGRLAGSVMLDLDMPANQPHRAEVQKLLVDPSLRRRGVARALMVAVEDAARAARRSLLVLDTREHDAAEALYRSLGWTESGRIPRFARDATGALHGTVLFHRELQD